MELIDFPGDDDFPSDAVLRRPFPNPRPLRRDLIAAHARLSDRLGAIDAELEAVLGRRQACLRELEPLRSRLNRRWTHHHVRRHARVDEPPVPPAPPGAAALEGTDLRQVCLTLLRRHGPQRLRDLHGLLHRYGYTVGGSRPVQRLGDAMAYEQRCGRAERVERGVYAAVAEGPRRVGRHEPDSPPAAPLPWREPVTDPPLLDPPVVADPQHWGTDSWPEPPDGPQPADPPDPAPDSGTPSPPPPPPLPSNPLGDDSLANRPPGPGEGDAASGGAGSGGARGLGDAPAMGSGGGGAPPGGPGESGVGAEATSQPPAGHGQARSPSRRDRRAARRRAKRWRRGR